MKRKKIARKVVVGFCELAVVLIACISLAVGVRYCNGEIQDYGEQAFSYARTAAEYIDGDRIPAYVETGEQDAYYRQIQDFFNAAQLQSDLKYYYVFVPYEDELVYVWDADNYEGACPLGYHEAYMEGGKEVLEQIYRPNPPENIKITRDENYGYIASAFSPIFNSAGEPVAVVGVDLSMPGIERDFFRFIIAVVISVVAVIFVSMCVFYVFAKEKVIGPIKTLNFAAKDMVGNLETEKRFRADVVSTGDEIEELAQSFEYMDAEVRAYISELTSVTAEKERIGAELNVATNIQASMLPRIFPPFPDRKEFEIYASMNPAKEVGGDFYDFFMVDERHLAIVVADVSGKGVPAALFMVIGKTLIKDHTQPGTDLGTVFTQVNELLCESNSEEMFITAFEGVLDLATGEFTFVNAGHETPFIARAGEPYQPHKIKAGFVLAGMEGMRYKAGSMQLLPGDKIFQYTDGVTEATNKDNELYGMERLGAVLAGNTDKTPEELLPIVKKDIDAFVGEAPQFDDITMLCLAYRERMEL